MALLTRKRIPAPVTDRREGHFERHSGIEAVADRVPRHANFSAPLTYVHRLSFERDDNIVASVVLLNFLSRPAAVAWAIVVLAVNAVNRVLFGRTLAHIFKKVLERLPPFAELYALTSVSMEAWCCRIFATRLDSYPYLIRWSFRRTVAGIAFNAHSSVNVNVQATTRTATAANEDTASNRALVAAVAAAVPLRLFVPITSVSFDYGPPAKLLSRQVIQIWHKVFLPFAMNEGL